MKAAAALVILSGCLLTIGHLTNAQMDLDTDCEQIRNLPSRCRMELSQVLTVRPGSTGANLITAFCSGDCFEPVLRAFERCGSEEDGNVQNLREGTKKIMPYKAYLTIGMHVCSLQL